MSVLRVAAAAIEQGGKVWSLPPPARHWNVMVLMEDQGVDCLGAYQGFVLSDGRFVSRRAAEHVAREAGQILNGGKLIGSVLTTEDLW